MIFSVVVPFFNEETYIERCLCALREQDFDKNEWEIIFVDNGSTDASPRIVRKFPEVLLLREERGNEYTARNKALGIARGEIIAFTDADCEVSKDWLSRIYDGMMASGAKIALGSREFPEGKSLPLRMFEDYENAKAEYLFTRSLKEYLYGFCNNMAIEAELFRELGLFTEYLGDTEFVHRYLSSRPDPRVIFIKAMKITHLEVTNIMSWLEKYRHYGQYEKRLKKNEGTYKPLDHKLRMKIASFCIKKNDYNLLQTSLFFLVMFLGVFFYNTGKIKGHEACNKGYG